MLTAHVNKQLSACVHIAISRQSKSDNTLRCQKLNSSIRMLMSLGTKSVLTHHVLIVVGVLTFTGVQNLVTLVQPE